MHENPGWKEIKMLYNIINFLQVCGAGLPDIPVALVPAPISLLPVTYPRDTFMQAKRAAIAFNSMIDAVSRDDEYIRRVLEPAARFDDFTVRYKICHLPLFFC